MVIGLRALKLGCRKITTSCQLFVQKKYAMHQFQQIDIKEKRLLRDLATKSGVDRMAIDSRSIADVNEAFQRDLEKYQNYDSRLDINALSTTAKVIQLLALMLNQVSLSGKWFLCSSPSGDSGNISQAINTTLAGQRGQRRYCIYSVSSPGL